MKIGLIKLAVLFIELSSWAQYSQRFFHIRKVQGIFLNRSPFLMNFVESHDFREREGAILIPLYHFQLLIIIGTFICCYASLYLCMFELCISVWRFFGKSTLKLLGSCLSSSSDWRCLFCFKLLVSNNYTSALDGIMLQGYQPPSKHHPLFFPNPFLNLKTVQVPLFRQSPYILFFCESST